MADSTQNQAKSALLFLYRQVLKVELPWQDEMIAAKTAKRVGGVDADASFEDAFGKSEGFA